MSENNQQVHAVVNSDELTEYIDSRIAANQPDPEQLAEDVAQYIDTEAPVQDELSEGQTRQVSELIAARVPVTLTPEQSEEVRLIVERILDRRGVGSGDGNGSSGDGPEDDREYGDGPYGEYPYGGVSEETEAEIKSTLQNLRVAGNPNHTRRIETGTPAGDYHLYGDWGMIITVPETVHWRSAVVVAGNAGLTRLQIYEMEFEEGETYDLGDIVATRDIQHESGPQEIYPDVTLEPGQYFVSRDPELVEPMRRVLTDVDWEQFNSEHDLPVRVEASWRAHADYTPDNPVFDEKYKANAWDRRLYYFGDMEFGFQGQSLESEG